MSNIYNYTRKKLEQKLVEMGEKPFRATQIFEWLYKKNVTDFNNMTNIIAIAKTQFLFVFII